MKVRVFVVKHIFMKPEEMLELDGTNMKILRKSANQLNTSEITLVIHFLAKLYCLPQEVITSEKSWKHQ